MRSTEKIAYETIRTPIGEVHLAAGPRGVVAIGLGGSPARFAQGVARRTGTLPEKRRGAAGAAARQVGDYLRGRRRTFRLRLDTRGLTDFQRAVLRAAARIPYGQTESWRNRPQTAPAAGRARGGPSSGRQPAAAGHPLPPRAWGARRARRLLRGARGHGQTMAIAPRGRITGSHRVCPHPISHPPALAARSMTIEERFS